MDPCGGLQSWDPCAVTRGQFGQLVDLRWSSHLVLILQCILDYCYTIVERETFWHINCHQPGKGLNCLIIWFVTITDAICIHSSVTQSLFNYQESYRASHLLEDWVRLPWIRVFTVCLILPGLMGFGKIVLKIRSTHSRCTPCCGVGSAQCPSNSKIPRDITTRVERERSQIFSLPFCPVGRRRPVLAALRIWRITSRRSLYLARGCVNPWVRPANPLPN